ncbi:MAG: ATP-dependent 6-phosphofructokinase [Elusimicrobiota bacterium]
MAKRIPIRRIGVLTSGGDCPGLNAVIRAVTKSAIMEHGLRVVGIEDGFLGLIEDRFRTLGEMETSNILTVGGTILGTNNKCDPGRYPVRKGGKVHYEDRTDRCVARLRRRRIDALVVIGGDGSMAVASRFVRKGVNCVGVPKTIDNDIPGTDVTFGFSSATAVATDAIDRVHTTAASHHRAMAVEVMGRNAGWIALYAGVAGGADVILLPEMPFDMDKVCRKVVWRSHHGKRFTILCVAEGARAVGGEQVVDRYDPASPEPVRLGGIGRHVSREIEARTGVETRCTVLGHVQRGGAPVHEDRVLGTLFGHAAVTALMAGKRNRLVVMKGRRVTDVALDHGEGRQRLVPRNHPLIQAARAVGTSFGD